MIVKFLKALVLVVLIFGALYFGLSYYFSLRTPVLPEQASRNAEELKVFREELTILEQKIQDQKREGVPVEDEEEAVANLRANIDRVKKLIAAEMPAERRALPAAAADIPAGTLFSDRYQKVFLFVLGALILFFIIFLIVRRGSASALARPRSRRPQPPLRPLPASPAPAGTAASDLAEQKLKETLQKFRNLSPEFARSDTREVPLAVAPDAPAAAAPDPAPEPRQPDLKRIFSGEPEPEPLPAKEPPASGSLVEKVFDLSKKGRSVEEISELAHIDQDQVRLILRFKQ